MEHYEEIKKSLEKLIKLCNTLIVVVTLQTIVIALVLIGFGAGLISSYLFGFKAGEPESDTPPDIFDPYSPQGEPYRLLVNGQSYSIEFENTDT